MNAATPFATLPKTAASHFKLVLLGTLLRLLELQGREERAATLERLPFLNAYLAECGALLDDPAGGASAWFAACERWASGAGDLPFQRLKGCGLTALHCQILATLALVEEDPRLSFLVEPEGGLVTLGGMMAAWRAAAPDSDAGAVRDMLLDLAAAGLADVADEEALRSDWRARLPAPVLAVLSSGSVRLDGTAYETSPALPDPATWLGEHEPEALGESLRRERRCLLVARGPRNNGRKTLVRAAARSAGLHVLTVSPSVFADASQWRLVGAVALTGNAMVVAELEPGPGETVELPAHPLFEGPIAVATGASGAVRAPPRTRTLSLPLPMPNEEGRRPHWTRAGLGSLADDLAPITLTTGNVRRAAAGAAARAALARRDEPTIEDVRLAARDLRDSRLDAVATAIDGKAPPDPLELEARDGEELEALLLRCRHRERFGEGTGSGSGVRAIFSGPSGTGKTLAARHIASSLGKDLFRIDLAATVSKYIGETEKSLERALSAAEELNIVLLLDEGDALMARRTDVGSSNDRYANLETNYLLQRIESFEGILIVTTNDAERIDPAFARRMDAVLTFRMPDEVRRRNILARQLGSHKVSERLIDEVACRCALSGGQLRNLALHARLLAMDAGSPVGDAELRRAVAREYRKLGDYSPLKAPLAAVP